MNLKLNNQFGTTNRNLKPKKKQSGTTPGPKQTPRKANPVPCQPGSRVHLDPVPTTLTLAVLRDKVKVEKNDYPPDPGRNRPHSRDFLRKLTVRTLPRDPPGGGGAKNKNRFKHSKATVSHFQNHLLGARRAPEWSPTPRG